MRISEVSDQDLSKWIAEKIEPTPERFPNMVQLHITDPIWSAKLCWTLGCMLRDDSGEWIKNAEGVIVGREEWQPRDMVNDPEMTVMLIEKARLSIQPELKAATTSCVFRAGITWMNGTVTMWNNSRTSERLGRAVAEAWAICNGWVEDQGK